MNTAVQRCKSSRYLQCAVITAIIVAFLWVFTDVFDTTADSWGGGGEYNDQAFPTKCVLPTGMQLLTTRDEDTANFPSFKITCPDVEKDIVCSAIKKHGYWESYNVKMMHHIIAALQGMPFWRRPKKNTLYLDVGGNVGYLAFSMAPVADRVVIIEASPRNAAALRHTRCVSNNFSHVGIFNYGVGEQRDQKCVLVSGDKNMNDYSVMCESGAVAVADGNRLGGGWPHDLRVRHHLTLTTIDDILDREVPNWREFPVKVMKIDIEGFELPAMKGARKLFSSLDSAPHVVLMEQWKIADVPQLFRVMQSYNYTAVSLRREDGGGVISPEYVEEYHKSMPAIEDLLFLRNDVAKATMDALSAKAEGGKRWPPVYPSPYRIPKLVKALMALGVVALMMVLVWCLWWVNKTLRPT